MGSDAAGVVEQMRFSVTAGAVGVLGDQLAPEIPLGSLLSLGWHRAKAVATQGWWRIVVGPIDPLQGAVRRPVPQ